MVNEIYVMLGRGSGKTIIKEILKLTNNDKITFINQNNQINIKDEPHGKNI